MRGPNAVFLTREEAVEAIRTDLQQYESQTDVLCELLPLVMGADAVAVRDAGHKRVWIKQTARGPMRCIGSDELAATLFSQMAAQATSSERLADFCAGVFQEPAVAGFDNETRREGVWVDTGMAGYSCRQCGRCCLTLDYHAQCTVDDYKRWQAAGRDDILQWVRCFPGKKKASVYRIWVAPGTETPVEVCPFLKKESGTEKRLCAIHAVKPDVCRQYPFTRKHARKTGCIGFDT